MIDHYMTADLRTRYPLKMLTAIAALLAVLLWSYFGTITGLVRVWWNEPDYVHGFFVPVFAAALLWARRDMVAPPWPSGSWWGVPLLALSVAMRWAAAYFYYGTLDPLSLVPCLAGVVLLAGGWRALWWAWPSVVYLVFMLRLPSFFADMMSHPLQRIGTIASTYSIQTLGIPAIARGNVIVLPHGEVGVVEACSGLRMLMLFLAVCVGAAFIVRRNLLEKIIIIASAGPIAVLANVFRITLTAVLQETVSGHAADMLYHDLAGWFMMPMAVLLLWAEMALLSRLVVDRFPEGPLTIGVRK